ncbi:MAG: hypothetical protein KBC15_01915 [Candidatus Levybacteria bacterium]|nr:hypothetical protein [Candidatus Levybacteria bacterium]
MVHQIPDGEIRKIASVHDRFIYEDREILQKFLDEQATAGYHLVSVVLSSSIARYIFWLLPTPEDSDASILAYFARRPKGIDATSPDQDPCTSEAELEINDDLSCP